MKKSVWPIIGADVLLAAFVMTALFGLSTTPAAAQDVIPIQVSPSAIILSSAHSGPVTVHADISYSAVASGTVLLYCDRDPNPIKPYITFPDDRGQLVAKFRLGDVIGILGTISGRVNVTFTLTGDTNAGGSFTGSDDAMVRQNPAPK
ncbi:MAG TPA: hypothetical protein VM118_11775 [Acidobacteriota bacterium]|nr:hypothetical protein [Acidobacteriota bacterium]